MIRAILYRFRCSVFFYLAEMREKMKVDKSCWLKRMKKMVYGAHKLKIVSNVHMAPNYKEKKILKSFFSSLLVTVIENIL